MQYMGFCLKQRGHMKKKSVLSIFLSLFILAIVLLTIQCSFESVQPQGGKNISRNISSRNAAKESDFSEERVLIALSYEASFRSYEMEDFNDLGIKIEKVEDLTELTYELIQMQLEAEKTGKWNEELEKLRKKNMLVNVKNYQKVLSLTLAEKGKDSVIKVIEQIQKSGKKDILYAGPDYIVTLCADIMPNDPYLKEQWGNDAIMLPEAWGITTGDSEVLLGILDTGIDATHPDLRNRVHNNLNRNFVPTPAVITNPPTDVHSHGTHVSGIAGGQVNNGEGIAGVAWGVSLVSLKVFNDYGEGYSSYAARAIDFAGRFGIDILNFSGGWRSWNVYDYIEHYDLALASIINVYPGLFVCAAGNDSNDNDDSPFFPASYNLPNQITVGAATFDPALGRERKALFPDLGWLWNGDGSNYGAATVHLFAPGTAITSTVTSDYCRYPRCFCINYPDEIFTASGYHGMSGTSMATPFVAGVAVLIKSTDSGLSAVEIKSRILNNVEKNDLLAPYCVTGGRLNAYKALGGEDITIYESLIKGVPKPAYGKVPVSEITEIRQYKGSVQWLPDHSVFDWLTQYTATITLEAKTCYTLEGVTADFFTVEGAVSVTNAINSGIITVVFPPAASFSGGNGTENYPYLIENIRHLQYIQMYDSSTTYFKLIDNIDLTNAWTFSVQLPLPHFYGYFDGNEKTISNLSGYQPLTSGGGFGLFEENSGTIENLNVTGWIGETQETRTGLIAGINHGLIKKCTSRPSSRNNMIYGTQGFNSYAGGITGYNAGTVQECVNYGGVQGKNHVGGIAGSNINSGIVVQSINFGSVQGRSNTGGIVGNNNGLVSLCYNTGEVYGNNENFGGIVGISVYGSVENTYNTGNVSGGENVGGIVGGNQYSYVESSYNTGNVSGGENVGGIAGWYSFTVNNCVSLGKEISGAENVARVSAGGWYYYNNKARDDLILTANDPVTITSHPNGIHGESIPLNTPLSAVFSGWDTGIWAIPVRNLSVNGALPTLQDMPPLWQNPKLP